MADFLDRNPIEGLDGTQGRDGVLTQVWMSSTSVSNGVGLTSYSTPIMNGTGAAAGKILNCATAAGTSVPTVIRIPHRRRLRTADGQVFQVDASSFPVDPLTKTKYIPVGATTIPVKPMTAPLVYGVVNATYTTVTYEDLAPFYSVDTTGYKTKGDSKEYRNVGAGATKLSIKTSIMPSFDTGGLYTADDAMLTLLRRCAQNTDLIRILTIDPSAQAKSFLAYVMDEDRSTKVDELYRVPFTYAIASDPISIDLSLS